MRQKRSNTFFERSFFYMPGTYFPSHLRTGIIFTLFLLLTSLRFLDPKPHSRHSCPLPTGSCHKAFFFIARSGSVFFFPRFLGARQTRLKLPAPGENVPPVLLPRVPRKGPTFGVVMGGRGSTSCFRFVAAEEKKGCYDRASTFLASHSCFDNVIRCKPRPRRCSSGCTCHFVRYSATAGIHP